ncbi:MAG TPA: gluconate 2-dehydrogenase subunit 3 family protein [Candidatus Bathyarchaeia archaeon]|nr:gluconate 2-dehydrogenase subunit 3 family protein [Candidatus Bathyarchaeia archaeon]
MKRRELLRAGVVAGAVAAMRPPVAAAQSTQNATIPPPPESQLTPAGRGVDASNDLAAANWKPLFLNEHQNETLIVLSELIMPATDTPGAKEALVNRYIDLVLAAETPEKQREFLNSLSYLDSESIRRCNNTFRYLAREDQDGLLHAMVYPRIAGGWAGDNVIPNDPGHAHFEALKERIVMAYYSSQIGEKELGWDGAFAHGPYQGCDHPEGSHK